MMNSSREIAAVLVGTPLAGLPISQNRRGVVVISGVRPDELLQMWRAARELVPTTGRWPVLITDDFGATDLDDPQPPLGSELLRLDEAARSTDPWEGSRTWMHEPIEERFVDFIMRSGDGVDLTSLVPRPGEQEPQLAVEHRLYRYVLANPGLAADLLDKTRFAVQTDYWYTPESIQLLLLPTDAPWLAAGFLDLFEFGDEDLAAALWQWHSRWGAELVASWGTMLQFVVNRPPQPGDQAWTLAGQILSVASHLEMHQWELAVALPASEAWFLHRRP